jgi:hypothetical protein
MDDRGHRPAPANRQVDHDWDGAPAMERHHEGSDRYRHSPGSAAAKWRTEGLDFVRDAIRLTYK